MLLMCIVLLVPYECSWKFRDFIFYGVTFFSATNVSVLHSVTITLTSRLCRVVPSVAFSVNLLDTSYCVFVETPATQSQ